MDDSSVDFTRNDNFDTWVDKTSSGDISSTTDFLMPSVEEVGMHQKRRHRQENIYGEPPAKKAAPPSIRLGVGFNWNLQALANAADDVQSGGKSPVSALNELGVRVTYTVLRQGGPAHCPSFTVSVNVYVGERILSMSILLTNPKGQLFQLLLNFNGPTLYNRMHNENRPFSEISIRMVTDRNVMEKHPIMILNELGTGYSFTDARKIGQDHKPVFGVVIKVADMSFEGWGKSKREARASAARACLAALLARAGRVLPQAAPPHDFTSDDTTRKVSEFQCLEAKRPPTPPKPPALPKPEPPVVASSASSTSLQSPAPSPSAALFGAAPAAAPYKSPINQLYETYPGLVFICTFGDGSPIDSLIPPTQLSHSMRFKVVCNIKDQKFEGFGSSKKLAKLAAARSALAVLSHGNTGGAEPSAQPHPHPHLDHISKLVNEKFNEIMKGDLVHSKRKVLAGIVITINNSVDDARVIAVTTGTKCVSGEHMSVRGRAVNDCHAEVAARRCFQRHLYAELFKYANSKDPRRPIEDSDLEPVPGGGYQMKPDRQVILYVSTAPCGDGRIFSPHEQLEAEPDRHPNRLARGQLRTKIESGEGTIPVKNCTSVIQTWDGVLQGERLLTMSCSDKVARWCVVGLQGALLSHYMLPVYLHAVVLGSLLHAHHMYRAICGRIEAHISSLPPPFRLHRPVLVRAASTEARTPARAPSFSVCWACTAPVPEVINATTGKLESGQPSLLCKQSMFARWQYLRDKISHLPQGTELDSIPPKAPENVDNLLYNEAKQLCPTYQAAKDRLIDAFEKANLGRWIKKPLEQDQFICEITNADTSALFA